MKKVANKDCREFVQHTQEFQGSNLQGIWEGSLYIVYSYGWYPLFVYDAINGMWMETSEKYSVSTSKQRGQAAPNGVIYMKSHNELKVIIADRRHSRAIA